MRELRLRHEDENVHVVGHHAVGEKFNPGKRRNPLQQLDEARTLLRIQGTKGSKRIDLVSLI